jgi:hypothetical protein
MNLPLLFKRSYLLADRCVGNENSLCGSAEAPVIGDRDERFQHSDRHRGGSGL